MAVWMLVILLALETAVQVRSQLRTGQSMLTANAEESLYVRDPTRQLTLLRPNRTFRGSQSTIQTNSIGLRGEEIAAQPAPDSLRIAIVGASSVMDPFAPTNADTISGLVERDLETRGIDADVINAGIAGATLAAQTRMIRTVVAPLKPQLVVVYPGTNDFSRYCRGGADRVETPSIESRIARQFLIFDLVLKNTTQLRDNPARTIVRKPPTVDVTRFRDDATALIETAQELGLPIVVSTNARAYTRDLPAAEQERQSADARYILSCFSLADLHEAYEQHNQILVDIATQHGVPVIRADRIVPGGARYFVDSTHMNGAGKRLLVSEIVRLSTAFAPHAVQDLAEHR